MLRHRGFAAASDVTYEWSVMRLSIVVPMLDEAESLPQLLPHLQALQRDGAEVTLVDGGSSDGSAEMAVAAGLSVVRSEAGRARQMNAGAAQAKGDAILFLHADTVLPAGAIALVQQGLAGDRCWGRFDVRISGRSPMLRVVAALMNLRSCLSGIATGDQAMFMTRRTFNEVGGFPELPLMEDIELSKRLRKRSRPVCLRTPLTTSGRRWESRGVWKTIFLMWRLRWAYWRGASAAAIAEAYR